MTYRFPFEVEAVDRSHAARAGVLTLARGTVKTPIFMPVGTQAVIRSLPPLFVKEIGLQTLSCLMVMEIGFA